MSTYLINSDKPERIDRDEHDYLYRPGELHFAASGPPMARNGWAVYPQDRDERRRPARIDVAPLLWGAYHDVPPTPEDIHRWTIYAATANTAIILGPPSGNVICLDCDILDEALSFDVRDVAADILGESPFRRVGTHPKVALFYRMSADDLPRYQKYVFTNPDGVTASEDMIEILARGRSITAEGLHYKTGSYFTWLDANPISSKPDRAPLITTEQIKTFFDEVEKRLRPFVRRQRDFDAPVDLETINAGGAQIEMPAPPPATRDPATGRIVDGRKMWLFELVKSVVVYNAGLAMREDPALIAAIHEKAVTELDLRGSDWTEGSLRSEIHKQMRARVQAMRDGKLKPKQVATWTADEAAGDDDTLSYFSQKTPLTNVEVSAAADPGRAEQRKLVVDRTAAREKVTQQLGRGISAWIEDAIDGKPRVHAITAPPGSGKTSRTVQMTAGAAKLVEAIRRTPEPVDGEEANKRGPIVFLLPSHANIDEIELFASLTHLDPAWNDEGLIVGAVEAGMAEEQAREQVDKIRRFAVGRALNVMRLDGKVHGGCFKADLVQKLTAAGASSGVLCKSKIRSEDGSYVDKLCDRYHECSVIARRRQLAEADVVFAPRAYLTLPLPAELKHVAGVVADERIFSDVIGSGDLPFELLASGRAAPALTTKERDAGAEEVELLADRQGGTHVVMQALRDGRDPADVLYEYEYRSGNMVKTGRDYVQAAKRVAGTAFTRGHSIDPSQPLEQLTRAVDELVAQPASAKLREEYSLWRTIEERIEKRANAELNSLADAPRAAKDPRLQYKRDAAGAESVRISYAADVNWADAPWLLLDASADEKIIESIFPGREIVTTDVSADVNMRAVVSVDFEWPNRLILPSGDCSPTERLEAAQTLANARNYISMVCGLHANGQVLVGTTLQYRKAIQNGWAPPANADFVHYGAIAGLDFARQHVAAIAIGRSEKPQSVIDGEVGALVRNDAEPEEPIDVYGLGGFDPSGNKLPPPPLVARRLRMRDGADMQYLVRQHAGPAAAALQSQYREEEVRQFIGRLRALQRLDTTTVYLVSKAIPDDTVIDRIVPMTEMKTLARPWEAVRRAGGVIEPRLLAKVAPDINTEVGFRQWLRKLPKAVLARYHRMAAGGVEYLVPGHGQDPVGHLRDALGLRPVDAVEIVERCACSQPPAAPRPVDKIERRLAERADERTKRVAEFMATQWSHIKQIGVDLAAAHGAYCAPNMPEEISKIAKPVDVWLGYSTIMDPWIRNDADQIEQGQETETGPAVAAAANDDSVVVVDPLDDDNVRRYLDLISSAEPTALP